MSKNSSTQRIDALRLWIIANIKNKSRDCVMFVNPQKRKAAPTHDVFAVKPRNTSEELASVLEDELLNT